MKALGVAHLSHKTRFVLSSSGCSVCTMCSSGGYHLCQTSGINNTVGIFRDGGWAQYCKVPAEQVYRLPQPITLQIGKRPISHQSAGLVMRNSFIPFPSALSSSFKAPFPMMYFAVKKENTTTSKRYRFHVPGVTEFT